jgi:hypothetical protein
LPNGVDPLTTDYPLTLSGERTTNLVGVANSFARSDHAHAIDLTTFEINSLAATVPLSVGKGGTGETTFPINTFLHGNGIYGLLATKTIPTGTVVGTSDTQNLSNKSIVDPIDQTKSLTFDLSNATTNTVTTLQSSSSTSNIITFPNASDVLIGKNTTDTLKNKTIVDSSNVVSAGRLRTTGSDVVISGTSPPITGNILIATSATSATWQNFGSLVDSLASISHSSDLTMKLLFNIGSTSNTTTTLQTMQTANRVVTLPDATDILVGKATIDTLTNKTLLDNSNDIANSTDQTKTLLFDLSSGITNTSTTLKTIQTTNQVLTLPNATDQLVGRATVDTLINKTLIDNSTFIANSTDPTKKIAFDASQAAHLTTLTLQSDTTQNQTITFPDSTDVLAGLNTPQTFTNKDFVDNSTKIINSTDPTKDIAFNLSGATPNTTLTINGTQTSNATITLPSTSDTLVGQNSPAVLYNKTLDDSTTVISNTTDPTKQVKFNLSNLPPGQTQSLVIPSSNGTIVLDAAQQTLTNKTMLSNTNVIGASDLENATGFVNISASPAPTSGQVLIATSNSSAVWTSILNNAEITRTISTQTTARFYVTMSGMTFSPPVAGTYLITFSSSGSVSNSSTTPKYAIFYNGQIVSSSEKILNVVGLGAANNVFDMHSQTIITNATTTDVIEVRFMTLAGSFTAYQRSLIYVRLA